ncbi:MAG: citrate/2-methylcitrate synthase [Sterolibacterium sp.]|nr:citrate/2-methylcitrate synthase [Sterolibacterium sp.]
MERKLYPNVDHYSGRLQKVSGIPVVVFTSIFSLARTVGWVT